MLADKYHGGVPTDRQRRGPGWIVHGRRFRDPSKALLAATAFALGAVMSMTVTSVGGQIIVDTSGTSITSNSFTPVNGDWLAVPFTTFGVTSPSLSVSDTVGTTGGWTIVSSSSSSNTNGIAYAQVGSGAANGTVTLTCTASLSHMRLEVLDITGCSGVGHTGTGSGSSASCTLSGAPASSSTVIGSIGIRTAVAEATTSAPSGFTNNGVYGSTTSATWSGSCYIIGSSPTTFAWSEQNLASTTRVTGVEFTALSGGVATITASASVTTSGTVTEFGAASPTATASVTAGGTVVVPTTNSSFLAFF